MFKPAKLGDMTQIFSVNCVISPFLLLKNSEAFSLASKNGINNQKLFDHFVTKNTLEITGETQNVQQRESKVPYRYNLHENRGASAYNSSVKF